jgi:hypothetical protein
LEGGGSDGWLTVVEFAPAVLLVGLALPLAVVAVVLGVRAVGLAAEGLAPTVDPKLFAALLYPVLVGGVPVVVTLLARGRPPTRAALLAAAGLGAAFVLDLGGVGVTAVPIQLALHRVALVGALGLFALGVAREDRRRVVLGAAAWVLVLAASLLGVV